MSSKRIFGLKVPTMDECSWLFLVYGIVWLYWSQSVYFVLGNTARLGSLAGGLIFIAMSAYIRTKGRIAENIPFVLLSSCYFALIQLLTLLQGHACWRNPRQLMFIATTFALFIGGYLIARGKKRGFTSAGHLSFAVTGGVAIIFLLAFLRYVQDISFAGSERSFGGTTLNPVGVAYANTCLMLVFLVLGFLSKNVIYKAIYFTVSALALFVVFSSASRGAIIWGCATVIFMIVLNRKRKYFSPKGIFMIVGSVLVALPVLLFLYKTNYAIGERLDILFERFESMFYQLIGDYRSTDAAVSARQATWNFYFNNFSMWILGGEKNYSGYYPHNQWLEILVRYGLLGVPLLFMSLCLMVGLCWDSLRRRSHPDVEFTLIVVLFMYSYLQSMSSLSLDVNRSLWLGFGYLIGYFQEKRKHGSSQWDDVTSVSLR